MGEFSPSPTFFWGLFFLFFLTPQTPQPGFGSTKLLQKFTPNFKILDPHLAYMLTKTYYDANPSMMSNQEEIHAPH